MKVQDKFVVSHSVSEDIVPERGRGAAVSRLRYRQRIQVE